MAVKEKFSLKKGYRGRTVFRITNIVFLFLVMLTMVVPILNIVSNSLDTSGTYGLNIIPKEPSLKAYWVIFTNSTLYRPFMVSIYTTVVGTIVSLAFITTSAYVLIQKEMPGNRIFVWMILFTMIFNGGLIPTYLLIKNIHLMNSLWAVILPLSVNVFNLILMKNFFEEIPVSLMEAAEIDGCTPMGIFLKVVLPLSKPALASIGLFVAVEYWNHFFNFVFYITDTTKYNFQIKLRELVLDSTNLANASSGDNPVYSRTVQYAAVIVSMLPPAIIYPFCQKYFVTGVTMGAVKE